MNKLTYLKTIDINSINIIESLAEEIWEEHYTDIIGEDQVRYMLDNFQSIEAIKKQIGSGYEYYLIQAGNEPIGYICFKKQENELFLSKFYLKSSSRGKGYGKETIKFIEEFAKKNNLKKISLTVNKDNLNSIEAYKKFNFGIAESIVTDIGSGYVMDDYKMEKSLL